MAIRFLYRAVRRRKPERSLVALIEDSATVKTFYREKDHIRLQPENDVMEPIIDDCQIIDVYLA